MGIETEVSSMEQEGRDRALLTGELIALGIPRILDNRVSALWPGQVEDQGATLSRISPLTPAIIMRITGFDGDGQKSASVTYTSTPDGGRLLRILGEEEEFNGTLPEDREERERVFVEALDRALNQPRRQPVLAVVGYSGDY